MNLFQYQCGSIGQIHSCGWGLNSTIALWLTTIICFIFISWCFYDLFKHPDNWAPDENETRLLIGEKNE